VDLKLAAATKLDRDLRIRAVADVRAIPEGWVIRHPGLAAVYHLNAVLLGAPMDPAPDADTVVSLCERRLGDLGHRHVVFDDAETAEQLAGALTSLGWERSRTLYMAFAGDPNAALSDPRSRRISSAAMSALQRAYYERENFPPGGSSDVRDQLVSAQELLRAVTPAVCFGAAEDGALRSMCTLFLDAHGGAGRVAMVEEVATMPEYRGRGLATAVVSAAIRAAREWGADLIVVPADADDWPQLLYAKLGFEPVGRQVTFTRRTVAPPGSVSGGV
jgi:GNAT superfamily N-acetyltransferase